MSSQSPSDVNPYAAPLADAEFDPEPGRRYGLPEPICLEGTSTVEEALRAYQALGVKFTRELHLVVLLGVAVVCYWSFSTVSIPRLPELSAAVLAGAGFMGLYFYLVLIYSPRHMRRELKEVIGDGAWFKYCFAEDEFTLTQVGASARYRWSQFASYETSGEFLLLRLQGNEYDGFAIPRSWCANEADWQSIEGLVDCKLPRREEGKTPDTRSVAEQPLDATVIAEGPAAGEAADMIIAGGHLTLDDVRCAMRLTPVPFWYRHGMATFIAIFVALALLAGAASHSPWAATPLAILAALVVYFRSNFARNMRSLCRRREGAFRRQDWRIGEEELTVDQPGQSLTIEWTRIIEGHMFPERIVLESKGRQLYVFPRHYFQNDDWKAFIQRVTARVSTRIVDNA